MVWWLKRNLLQKFWATLLEIKGGDGAIVLFTGQIIARDMVLRSCYKLTAKRVLTTTDAIYGESNAYETLFCKCPVD